MGKVWVQISQVLHMRWVFDVICWEPIFQVFPIWWIFPCYGKSMRKPMLFPYDEVYPGYLLGKLIIRKDGGLDTYVSDWIKVMNKSPGISIIIQIN